MSPTGDYTFGQSGQNFLVDSPAAVGQAALTRLRLWAGEWFLNLEEGTPYWQQILAHKNLGLAEAAIRDRILGTPFATGLTNFSVVFNSTTRALGVTGILSTAFGVQYIDVALTDVPVVQRPGDFSAGQSPLGPAGGLL